MDESLKTVYDVKESLNECGIEAFKKANSDTAF